LLTSWVRTTMGETRHSAATRSWLSSLSLRIEHAARVLERAEELGSEGALELLAVRVGTQDRSERFLELGEHPVAG